MHRICSPYKIALFACVPSEGKGPLIVQDVWSEVNSDQKSDSAADSRPLLSPLQPMHKARQCSVCGKDGQSLVRCGGPCKRATHPACIDKQDAFTVSRFPPRCTLKWIPCRLLVLDLWPRKDDHYPSLCPRSPNPGLTPSTHPLPYPFLSHV